MTSPPWLTMVQARRRLGLTQAELAVGIVTQSFVCQMERGKVCPSEGILEQLAERLSLDVPDMLVRWRTYRQSSWMMDRLWNLAQRGDGRELAHLLREFESLIPNADFHFYTAFVCACNGNVVEAERALRRGWQMTEGLVPQSALLRTGQIRVRPGREGWYQRLLEPATSRAVMPVRNRMLQAWTRVRIASLCGQTYAAAFWMKRGVTLAQEHGDGAGGTKLEASKGIPRCTADSSAILTGENHHEPEL